MTERSACLRRMHERRAATAQRSFGPYSDGRSLQQRLAWRPGAQQERSSSFDRGQIVPNLSTVRVNWVCPCFALVDRQVNP